MTDTVHIGSKFHFYPDEMKLLLKVFNHFPIDQLNGDEDETFNHLLDSIQEFVMINS